MNNTQRKRVIVHTEPQLVGAALGAWLAGRPGLDVVVDPVGKLLAEAGEGDVLIVSAPIESDATVLVVGSDGLSIFSEGIVLTDCYRNLDQLYSVITQRRGPPRGGVAPGPPPEGGGWT